MSRSTPTIAGDLLVVGIYGPAVVIAVKRSNGKLVWSTRQDNHARSFITISGTCYKGFVLDDFNSSFLTPFSYLFIYILYIIITYKLQICIIA